MKNTIGRRKFFGIGMASLGTLAATRVSAQTCAAQQTASQDLGPFFPRPQTPSINTTEDPNQPVYLANDNDLTFIRGTSGSAKGEIVIVDGRLTDDSCKPISGATIIIWQASDSGRYNHNGDLANHQFDHPETGKIIKRELDTEFQYWGKTVTDANGEYSFKTIVPGFYPADLAGGWYRPPHIHFLVSATGFDQFVTQLYFKGDIKNDKFIQALNDKDALLQGARLSKKARARTQKERDRLVVDFQKNTDGVLEGQFDIQLG